MNNGEKPSGTEKPHYLNHRKRLKQKFLRAPDGLDDAEIIELLLGYVIRRRDVKPESKSILAAAKHIGNIFESDFKSVKGVGDETALLFRIIRELNIRVGFRKINNQKIELNDTKAVYDFLWNKIAHFEEEAYMLLFLNAKNRLQSYKLIRKGIVNRVPIFIREIIEESMKEKAVGVIISHNHPADDVAPSESDLTMTKNICHALKHTGIALLDHIIVSYHDYYSMRASGYIKMFYDGTAGKL